MSEETVESLASRVIAFVAREAGVPKESITLRTTLLGDLGIAGVDGEDILAKFADEFHVDVSRVELGQYFGDEASGCPLGCLLTLFELARTRDVHRAGGVHPISVANLVKAAQKGVWFE